MTEKGVKLTPKQRRFIVEYLVDFNGTQAAIRAGYSRKVAAEVACENLMKPHIRDEINHEIEKILNDTTQKTLQTIREAERLSFADISEFLEYDDDGVRFKPSVEVDTRPVSQVVIEENAKGGRTMKLRMHDKNKSLELLSKLIGAYKERHEIKIETDYSDVRRLLEKKLNG